MEQKDIAEILLKYELGISSAKENELIESWYNAQEAEDWSLHSQEHEDHKNNILLQLHQQITPQPTVSRPFYRSAKWIATAAAVLLVAFILLFNQKQWSPNANHTSINQFKPGKDQAILKLDNGSSVDLNGNKSGIKIVNGALVYLDGSPISDGDLASRKLTVEVPKGGQYQVNLPDGSSVWLNAASTLSYPMQFSEGQREVSLTGEAYFEVSKNPHKPFIVKSRNQEVKVLGTIFNINGYEDREFVETTLIEGAVTVNQQHLNPGQRALISGTRSQILPANMESAIAWRKGYFLFDEEPLSTILASLSRWYNVDFEYENPALKQLMFWGSIDRNQPLTKTLTFLESTNQLQFDYRGNNSIVVKKK